MTIRVKQGLTYTGHRDSIYALTSGLQQNSFISGGGDGYIVEWNIGVAEGKLLARIESGVYTLFTSPHLPYLFAGAANGNLYVFNLEKKAVEYMIPLHRGGLFDITFIGNNLYTSGFDGSICALNTDNFELQKRIKISTKSIRKMLYIEASHTMLAGASDGFIYQIPLDNPDAVTRLSGHENSIFALCYNPITDELMSGGRDALLHFHRLDTLEETNVIQAHLLHIKDIIYWSSLQVFLTASMDKSIKIWQADNHELLKVIDKPKFVAHSSSVNKLIAIDDLNVISASDDKQIMSWALEKF